MTNPKPPLQGMVVLSVGHTLPGHYCLAALRDLGAEVVRIEPLSRGEKSRAYASLGELYPTRSLKVGTSEVNLDLKQDGGKKAFRRLAARADAVLEGFRPGVMTRLGIDYDTLSADHPSLVYVSISGFGQEGPLRDRPGHDANYLAETGVLNLANPRGLPGVTFADGLAGLSGALNVLAALFAAKLHGEGQALDVAIVDAPLFLMTSELERYWRSGAAPSGGETMLTGEYPWYGVHETRDGGAVVAGAVEPAFHDALFRGLGRPELAANQFPKGGEREEMRDAVSDAFASRTRDEAMKLFENVDTCVSPIRTTDEVAESSLMERALRGGREAPEKLLRSTVRLPPAEVEPERSGAAVLERFGLSAGEIRELIEAGVLEG